MALQSVTPAQLEDVPNNDVEQLLYTAFGKNWIRNGMRDLTHQELRGARSLAFDHMESAIKQIAALGTVLGEMQRGSLGADRITSIGWAIRHLADHADLCSHLVMMAEELQTPEGRAWQLEGKLGTKPPQPAAGP